MMLGVLMPLILIIGPADAAFDVSFDVLSTLFLPYTYVPTAEYALGKNAAEQLAYDVDGQLLYSVGKYLYNIFIITRAAQDSALEYSSASIVHVLVTFSAVTTWMTLKIYLMLSICTVDMLFWNFKLKKIIYNKANDHARKQDHKLFLN